MASTGRFGVHWLIWRRLADLASTGRFGIDWPIWHRLADLASTGRFDVDWSIWRRPADSKKASRVPQEKKIEFFGILETFEISALFCVFFRIVWTF